MDLIRDTMKKNWQLKDFMMTIERYLQIKDIQPQLTDMFNQVQLN